MTTKKTKTTKKTSKRVASKPSKGLKSWFTPGPVREASTLNDTKTAILVVSLTINLAIFIGWLALRITDAYDEQVANLLFSR